MTVTRLVPVLLLLLLALPSAGRAADLAFERGEAVVLTKSGARHRFEVEIARSDDQLARGLMNRRSLPIGTGMLFDFGAARPVTMWMKNTLISLDMLFIDAEGRIARIAERTEPMSEALIPGPDDTRAVLELAGGTARLAGIAAGDRLERPNFGHR